MKSLKKPKSGKKNIWLGLYLPVKLLIQGILSPGRDLSKTNDTFMDSLLLEVQTQVVEKSRSNKINPSFNLEGETNILAYIIDRIRKNS